MKRFIITSSSQQMRRLRTITSLQNATVTKQVLPINDGEHNSAINLNKIVKITPLEATDI